MIFDAWRKYSKNIASSRAMDSKHGKKLSLSHQCTTRRINLFLSIIDYKIFEKERRIKIGFFSSKIVVPRWSFFSEASSELDEVWISNWEYLLWFYNIFFSAAKTEKINFLLVQKNPLTKKNFVFPVFSSKIMPNIT